MARTLTYLCLAAAVAALAIVSFQAIQAKTSLHKSQESMLASGYGLTAATTKRLAPEYSDADGGLLADPPTDESKLLDPEQLVVACREDPDADEQPVDWKAFQSHLAQATGKEVAIQSYSNTVEDVADVKKGKIHVVALHAADTPFLVNNAGFIPVAVLGSGYDAIGNRLNLAVKASSNIKTLADLKGRTVTHTRPSSITGHRAAVAVLLREAGLRPNVDYFVNYSLGQKRSIVGVTKGDYEAAAISNDKLQALLDKGEVQRNDLRVIYQSEVIPRFTIGHIYNLGPALAAKITEAITSFANEGAPTPEDEAGPMRFVAIDYKDDFDFVRKIDESFDPRLETKPDKGKMPAVPEDESSDT